MAAWAQDADGGHSCHRSVQELAHMLCRVPLMGSCSQICVIVHPHHVAVPFPPTFASPWRNSFVLHGEQLCSRQNLGPPVDHTQGVGSRPSSSPFWYNYFQNSPRRHEFPINFMNFFSVAIYTETRNSCRVNCCGDRYTQSLMLIGEEWVM